MEQLTKNQAVATSQEAVQNQNEPQLRDENAHNDKSVHGVLNPTYQAGLRRDAVQPDIEAERKKRDEIEAGKSYCSRRFGGATCDDKSAQIYARFDKNDWRIQPAEFYRFHDSSEISESVNFCVMEAIKLCRLDTPIIFIEARINLSRFVVTGCAAKTSATVTFPSLNLILVSWIKHSVDRFVIVSIFIPKLRLILILNSFLGSSDSLVFSELFHSLAPRPLAARSISDFLLTYLAT